MGWTFSTNIAHPSRAAQNMGYSGSHVTDPQIGSQIAQLPAALGGAASSAFGSFANGLGGMFGSYGNALGNLATAGANERSNLYGAQAMMEAARQGTIGNIGSAGLGAFGSASNSAFDAWARNQQAYNQSLAAMNAANQGGMSQLGQSRNMALGNAAQAAGNTMSSSFNMGGRFGGGGGAPNMSMYAGSPSGMVASGSYGNRGGGGAGGSGMQATGSVTRGNADMIGRAMGALDNQSYLSAMQQGAQRDADRLDRQHYTSREQPQQMLGGVLGGLRGMMGDAFSNANAGADQYYANSNRALDAGLSQQGGLLASLNNQFGGATNQLGGGFGGTMGILNRGMNMVENTGMFSTPVELARRQREEDLFRRASGEQDNLARMAVQAARSRAFRDARERLDAMGVSRFRGGNEQQRAMDEAGSRASLGLLGGLMGQMF